MKTVEEIKNRCWFLKGKIDGFNRSRVQNAEEKTCVEACLKELQWVVEDNENVENK